MKKILFLVVVCSSILLHAQKLNYREFLHDYKYGVVDLEGKEILPPTYDWKMYTLHHSSPFMVLMSKDLGPLIFNNETGKSEKLKSIAGASRITIGQQEYIYAYNEKEAFLMNNKNLDVRLNLPKTYARVWEMGGYLVGVLSEDTKSKVDIFSKDGFIFKLKDVAIIDFARYNAADLKLIYVLNQPKKTVIFDENMVKIAEVPRNLKTFAEVDEFLRTKKKINIVEMENKIISTMVGPPPLAPYIDLQSLLSNIYVCNVYDSRNNYKALFTFNAGQFRVGNDAYKNQITLDRKEQNKVYPYLSFYVDVETGKILFPEKYWKDIELTMVVNDLKKE